MAFIQFMTRPIAPRRSPSMPIRKPGWSTMKTSGMLNESHSTMNEVAFSQASTSIAPPLCSGLFAITPTTWPSMRASAVTMFLA